MPALPAPARHFCCMLLFIRFFCLILLLSLARTAPAPAAPSLDAAFGRDGRVAVELGGRNSANAVLVQPDGRIVVAGSVNPGAAKNFSLLRFNPDGTLDTGFNHEGALITSLALGDDEALALGQLSDGRIVAGGYTSNGASRDFALACYFPDGTLDRDFGLNGITVTPVGGGDDEITALAITPDDRIVIAGNVGGTNGSVAAAARYDALGELDAGFGERGITLVTVGDESRAEGLLLREDGGLLLSGTFRRGDRVSLMLVALDKDGLLDTDFGDQGVAMPHGMIPSEGYRLAADKDGLVYVAGAVGEPGRRDTALFRFFMDGRLDPDFGLRGAAIHPASPEDDVLFDVAVSDRGVVASGFATEGGRRRFLVASYAAANGSLDEPFLPVAQLEAPGKYPHLSGVAKRRPRLRRHAGSAPAARPPKEAETPYAPGSPETAAPDAKSTEEDPLSQKRLPWPCRQALALLRWLAPTPVFAAELPAEPGPQPPKVALFDFGGDEAVGYAAALDAEGNVLVVGTVAQGRLTSMALARFAAASLYNTNAFVNQNGTVSTALRTLQPLAITRSSARSGGEILPELGAAVRARGLVFSTAAHPVLERVSAADNGPQPPATALRGHVAAGSGPGAFEVLLSGLQPGTLYHVRAYAITEDGAAHYGPERRFHTADACFLATAAFGSISHPAVILLRQFRDTMLSTKPLGQALIGLYYRLSPPLAALIEQQPALRLLCALALLPLLAFAWLALHLGLAPACGIGLVLCLLPLRARLRTFHQNARGFTLIEVMVVMLILSILAVLVVPRIMDRPEDARRTQAMVQMSALEQALKLYRLDNGQYPTTEQGLQALVAPPVAGPQAHRWRQGGYLERGKVPKDPWGGNFVYLSPGLHDDFDLISYGADRQPGGEGRNADVNNWELQ